MLLSWTEDQKLSKFILGLEGRLANEVESLRPASLVDALIRAKSKLNNFLWGNPAGDHKRAAPYYPTINYKALKVSNITKQIEQT